MTVFDLTGRKALVTGGAQGSGEGMAQALAARRRPRRRRRRAGRPRRARWPSRSGDGHGFVHLDVTDDASWEDAVAAAAERPRRPGHPGQQRRHRDHQPDHRRRPEGHPHDARGQRPRHRARHQARPARDAPRRRGRQRRRIINVASVAATIAFPGIPVYSATKSAVDRLTRVAAMEAGKLGYGVRVNCIYPGLVPTAMGAGLANDMAALGLFASPEEAVGAVIELTPSGRLGEVADMADAVVFLASDAVPLHHRRRPAGRRRNGHVSAMTDKPVVVYGASGYTGRLICEYLREYHVPFVAAGRDGGKLKTSMESNVAGIETADYEVAEVDHDVDVAHRAVPRRLGRLQHRRPVQQVRPRGRRGLPGRRRPLPRHHRRAGLADHLRRAVRRRLRRRRPAARRPASRRCTPPARSRPSSAWRSPAWTPSTSRCSGAAARPSPRPRRSWSTPPCPARTTSSRTPTSRATRGRPTTSWSIPGQHELGAGAAVGRHLAPGLVQAATRGSPTSRRSAGSSTGR